MERVFDIFTFVAVEHDWREQEVCLFCDVFVCFKNICEIDSGSSVWVPCKSKSTTDKWLISIKSYESSIWLDIKGSVPEWHDVIDFQISLWTIIWFSYQGFISRSLAPLTVSHGHMRSRVAILAAEMPQANAIPFLNRVLGHRIGLDVDCRLQLYRKRCELGHIRIFGEIQGRNYLQIGRWECVLVEFEFPKDKIWMSHSFWLWFFRSFEYRSWRSFDHKVDVLDLSCRLGSEEVDGPVRVHPRWPDRVYRRVSQLETIFDLFNVNFWVSFAVKSVIFGKNGWILFENDYFS